MSVKETIHQWVERLPDNSPGLQELYEEARLDLAIDEAQTSLAVGGGIPVEEVISRFEQKCQPRLSA